MGELFHIEKVSGWTYMIEYPFLILSLYLIVLLSIDSLPFYDFPFNSIQYYSQKL